LIMFNSYMFHGFGQNKTTDPRVSLAFNVLANLSDRDTYKLDFVKKERWVDNHNADYVVKSDGTEGTNSIEVKNGGSVEDGTIRRRMSK
jgi:ectoine hydroxylase-related dioxygenase (phytanoyl-CoA dioxygenase family)